MTTKDLNQRLFEAMGAELKTFEVATEGDRFLNEPIRKVHYKERAWVLNGVEISDRKYINENIPIAKAIPPPLPNACDSWEVCRKYVILFMRGKGYRPSWDNGRFFWWKYRGKGNGLFCFKIAVINDNLPLALVEATLKVLEKDNGTA